MARICVYRYKKKPLNCGKLPSIETAVKVKGTVRDTKEGKFLFADKVENTGK